MALDTGQAPQGDATIAREAHPRPLRLSHIGETPLREFGRQILRGYLRKLRKRLGGVNQENNVEAIHDVRVAIRSLRAALGMLEAAPGFDAKELRRLRRGLRRLASLLGETRDLDVLIQRVEEAIPAGNTGGDLSLLRDRLVHNRERAYRRLLKELDRPRTARLLRDVRQVSRRSSGAGRDTSGARVVLVRHFAGSAIWRRYEEVLSFETTMPDADIQTLHELRIACKHLRYVLEPFAEEAEEPQPVLTLLKDAQQQLGSLHDAVVAIDTIEHSDGHGAAITALQQALRTEGDRLRAGVAPLWHRLSDPNTRLSLAAFIAAL